jgi:hypothetical protein
MFRDEFGDEILSVVGCKEEPIERPDPPDDRPANISETE